MNSNKNVLFITNLHLWSLDKGKGGRAFITTVEGYKKGGWNIWFISSGGGIPDGLLDKDKLFEMSFSALDRLWTSKFRLISIGARFIKMLKLNNFFYRYGREILRKQKNKSFIIYAYEVDAVAAAKKLSREFDFPLVTRFQGTKHNNTANTIANRIKKAPHLQAMGTDADITIMTNDGTQGLVTLRRLNNRSKEILFWRNGVAKVPNELIARREQLRNDFGFPSSRNIFLTVSRLVNWKKVERAIHAFADLISTHPNCELVILGDGEAKTNLMKLSEDLGIAHKVRFTGAVEQSSVSKYMVASDVFLSFYDLSNVGNPLMEAMMCGKPIITLDVGDTKELIDTSNGVLISPENIGEIPSVMRKLLDEPEYSNVLSEGAMKTAHEQFWDWEERIEAEVVKVTNLLNK